MLSSDSHGTLHLALRLFGILFAADCLYWESFEMRLLNLRINFFIVDFCPHLGSFLLFFSRYVSAKFHLWPSSGDLPRPWIEILSLVNLSPVITAFHSCPSHHVFDQED